MPEWINGCLTDGVEIAPPTESNYINDALSDIRPLIAWVIIFYIACSLSLFAFYFGVAVQCYSKCQDN